MTWPSPCDWLFFPFFPFSGALSSVKFSARLGSGSGSGSGSGPGPGSGLGSGCDGGSWPPSVERWIGSWLIEQARSNIKWHMCACEKRGRGRARAPILTCRLDNKWLGCYNCHGFKFRTTQPRPCDILHFVMDDVLMFAFDGYPLRFWHLRLID